MKIQELAIIFVIIILPISLLLSEYTQFQIQTLKTQTEYDSKLTAATYDAIKAFQLNSTNSTESGLANSEMRDLTASVNSFRNSLMSTFKLNGYTEEELNSYIPALVYTLYDGFYIYSPYKNINHRYEIAKDAVGNEIYENGNPVYTNTPTAGNGEELYGIKPYISYSCRYIYPDETNPSVDVVITYSLDNYITVQGMVDGVYVNKGGYIIEINDAGDEYQPWGIYYKKEDDGTETVRYNGELIMDEQLKEYLPLPNADDADNDTETYIYKYAKINGIKYYLIPKYYKDNTTGEYKHCIVYIFNGTPIIQAKQGEEKFELYKNWIEKNGSAKKYFIDAYNFTKWFQSSGLRYLKYGNAYDEVINTDKDDGIPDGEITLKKLWPGDDTRIFRFRTGGPGIKSIETEYSNFNQHRLAIIRNKIETNLAIAIANYNSYSKASNVFQIPQLKETEWDSITHNIALISFMQGLPIGGKLYNGYSIVTNSESDKVVLEENIYILSESTSGEPSQKAYRRIGDKELDKDIEPWENDIFLTAGSYTGDSDTSIIHRSAGRLNLDFERAKVIKDGEMKYYYPLKEYNASYNSIVMQNEVTTYDDIYEYIESQNSSLAQAFYTALARERGGMYITLDDINSSPSDDDDFESGEEEGSGEAGGGETTPVVNENLTIIYHLETGDEDNDTVMWTGLGERQLYTLLNPLDIGIQIPGKNFAGWALVPNTDKPLYKIDENNLEFTITLVEDIDLYAVWLAPEYIVTFDANGGENAPGEIPKIHDIDIQLPPDKIPTSEENEFLGWSDSPTATSPKSGWEKEKVMAGEAFYTKNADATLYAVWIEKTYSLTYWPNASGVTNLPEKQYWSHGDNVTISMSKPKRDGFVFMGWNTNSNAGYGSSDYEPGKELVTPNINLNLYAIWKESCELYLDADGGKIHNNGSTYERLLLSTGYIGSGAAIPYLNVQKTGCSFEGWADSPGAQTAQYKYGDVYKFEKTGENVLYAVWKEEIKTYTIIFKLQDGEKLKGKVDNPLVLPAGTEITFPGAEKTGFKFLGWSSSATSKTVRYYEDKPWRARSNLELWPVWEEDIIKYTVTYNPNDGSGLTSSESVNAGKTITLPTPTRENCEFLGWTASTGGQYGGGINYTVNGNVTFTANWKFITYTLVFDANGGNVSPDTQTVAPGVEVTLPTPTRDGYNFAGWSIRPSGEIVYAEKYIVNKDITFVAKWEAEQYLVTYNANEGLFDSGSTTMTEMLGYDEEITSIEPTRLGYKFNGWSLFANGTVKYKSGDNDKFKETTNTTLYAVWEQVETCTLSYRLTGIGVKWESGSSNHSTQTVNKGDSVTITTDIPTRTSYVQTKQYTFKGWNDKSNGTGKHYDSGQVITLESNMILYPEWNYEAKKYTITYDANGGEGAPENQTKTHGETLTLSPTPIPKKDGYVFKGWATSSSATEADYLPGKPYTAEGDNTLYAVWGEPAKYTITFDPNGGTWKAVDANGNFRKDSITIIAVEGEPIGNRIPGIEKKGQKSNGIITTRFTYNFVGWKDEETGEMLSSYEDFVPTRNMNLIAVWEKPAWV